jgi:hypothetical protein
LHLPERRPSGFDTGTKTVGNEPIEHVSATADYMHRHVPGGPFAAYDGRRLMIANENHDEIAIGMRADVTGKSREFVRDRVHVTGAQIAPVGLPYQRPGRVGRIIRVDTAAAVRRAYAC